MTANADAGRVFGLVKRAFAFNWTILSLVFVAFLASNCFSVKRGLPLICDLEIFFLGFALGFALDFALGLALVLALGLALGFALALLVALGFALITFLGPVAPVLLTVAFLVEEVVVLPVWAFGRDIGLSA